MREYSQGNTSQSTIYNQTKPDVFSHAESFENNENEILALNKNFGVVEDTNTHAEYTENQLNWLYIAIPALFNWVPLAIMLISYCLIWVRIRRSNNSIEGMVAFNKHQNEVRY